MLHLRKLLITLGGCIFWFPIMTMAQTPEQSSKVHHYFILGGGVSSFQGYAVHATYELGIKNHLFGLRWNLNNQTGHYKRQDLIMDLYNDRNWDLSLLFGEEKRSGSWVFSALAGGGLFRLLDKTLVENPPNGGFVNFNRYSVIKEYYHYPVLVGQTSVLYCFSADAGIGITLFGKLTYKYSIAGITLNMVWGVLNDE